MRLVPDGRVQFAELSAPLGEQPQLLSALNSKQPQRVILTNAGIEGGVPRLPIQQSLNGAL